MMKIVVISHAMVQDAPRARWRRLAELYPVSVTLLVPSRWESSHFGKLVTWNPQPISEGFFNVVPLSVIGMNSESSYFFKSWDAGLRQLQPDIIFVVQEEFSPVLHQMIEYRRLWARRAKVIFFSWNNIAISSEKWRSRLLWRHTCIGSDMAVAGNSEVRQVLQKAGYHKPIVVQTEIGVDERIFRHNDAICNTIRAKLGLHGFVIGYAGRITEMKGLRDLFKSLIGLKGEWSLLLVGDGDMRSELTVIAKDRRWNIHCTGYLNNDDMPDYFQAMDCLVLPSRTTVNWKEQFGLVLAQAMACHVPVIGSNSGAIPEVIGDAGLVFPEGDITALSNCLQQLMDDKDLRLNLAQKGYNRAMAKYSAKALADETYTIFTEVKAKNL